MNMPRFEQIGRWLTFGLVVAATSAIVYARMQHAPPIFLPWLFAVLIAVSLVGLLILLSEYPDED